MLPLAEDLTHNDLKNEAAQEITIEGVPDEDVPVEDVPIKDMTVEDVPVEDVTDVAATERNEVNAEPAQVASPANEETKDEGAAKRDDSAKHDDGAKSGEESMASSAERMTILRMVEQGKISAEEGARLLSALGNSQGTESNARPTAFDTSRQVQVRVSDLGTNRPKVNVTLPVGLLQLAWNWLPTSAKAQFDQVQAALNSGASGRLVEVVDQDSGVRVEISVL